MTSAIRQASPKFQFTLRSLWVKLTVACVLFGFVVDAYHTVEVRKSMYEQLRLSGSYVLKPFGTDAEIRYWYGMHRLVPPRRRGVSLIRQLFGDSPIVLIEPKGAIDPAAVARMRRYFPEAIFIRNGRQALD